MREAAPGATAADADERTGRLDAIGRGLQNLFDHRTREGRPVIGDAGLDGIADQATGDENGFALVRSGETVRSVCHSVDGEPHGASRVCSIGDV